MKSEPLLTLAENALAKALKEGADAGDVLLYNAVQMSARHRMGKAEIIERAESKGLAVRVFVEAKGGLRQASVSTSDTSEKALAELVERAVAMARISPADPYVALAPKELLATTIPDLELADTHEPSAEALKNWAAKAEDAALAVKGVTNSDGAEAAFDRSEAVLVTSNGFAQSTASTSFSLSVGVVAGSGTAMETDYDYTVARHAADIRDAATIGRSAGERAVKRLNPAKEKTAQVPVVFEPRVARSLLQEFAGAINGAAVARGSSFLDKYLGKQVFAKGISIIDDPFIRRGLASEPFDGEGVAGKKRALIEDGILTTWLLDMRSSRQLGLTTTGHAARGLGSPPSPSSTNLYMQAGTVSPEALIADIADGFYVTDAFGMGVNGVTGDYSQGASGFWIRNGQLTNPVSEMTIAGNLKAMFLNLIPANDLELRYGTNSPTLRIEGMMVAGS